MEKPSRIVELASTIQEGTLKIDSFFQESGTLSPSNSIYDPLNLRLPDNLGRVRDSVREAMDELNCLLLGPVGYLTAAHSLLPVLFAMFHRYPEVVAFPVDETSTFESIAFKTDLAIDDVSRLLRTAATHRIFRESAPGVVSHTALSRAIAEVPLLTQYLGFSSEDVPQSTARLVEAMARWPGSEENSETGYSLGSDSLGVSFFERMEYDAHRAKRFEDTMQLTQQKGGFEREWFVNSVDWTDCDLVVDVGGGAGHTSIELAKRFPAMRLVSQDLDEVIEQNTQNITEDMRGRVIMMAHDFLVEQPIKGADAYVLQWIFHNWGDGYAIKILQALVPALKLGARILISDMCMPAPGTLPLTLERRLREMDLVMKALYNGKERDADEWAMLFQRAGPGFKLKALKQSPRSMNALIEVVWAGEDPLESI